MAIYTTHVVHELIVDTVRLRRGVHLGGRCTRRVVLLNLDEAAKTRIGGLPHRAYAAPGLEVFRYRHPSGLDITQHIPGRRQLLESWVRHARDKAGELLKYVDTRQIGIGERALCVAA